MPRISAIATAVPDLDFEPDYRRWALSRLGEGREGKLYERMANRSGIEHRWSVLDEADARLNEGVGFYGGEPPSTSARMAIYAKEAPELALKAIAGLPELGRVTHLVVASCTGFVAPGIDQIVARRLGLGADVERVLVGFMGCYAAVTALRTARHIVRSEPLARVLVVTVELSSLHHQEEMDLEPLLLGAHFGEGAAAAIVTAGEAGLELGEGISAALALAAAQRILQLTQGLTLLQQMVTHGDICPCSIFCFERCIYSVDGMFFISYMKVTKGMRAFVWRVHSFLFSGSNSFTANIHRYINDLFF